MQNACTHRIGPPFGRERESRIRCDPQSEAAQRFSARGACPADTGNQPDDFRAGISRGEAPWLVRLLSFAVALAAAAGVNGEESRTPREDTARLLLHIQALERQLELASGDMFYLLVDPGAQELTLRLGAVTLQRLELRALSATTARVAFMSRSTSTAWQGLVWSGGRLTPERERERQEIIPPDPASVAPPPFEPPAAEEAVRVPARYTVRFDDGFALEVEALSRTGPGALARALWRTTIADPLAAFGPDRVRLRITVSPEHGAALYRSLPPDVRLLVLPGPAAAEQP
jgi:hypothetical protein